MAIENAHGRVTYLRVHKKGTQYGGANDVIDVEVVIHLEGQAGQAFGFPLRDDGDGPAYRAMFDLLLSAYERDSAVYIGYVGGSGQNHELIRVWEVRA